MAANWSCAMPGRGNGSHGGPTAHAPSASEARAGFNSRGVGRYGLGSAGESREPVRWADVQPELIVDAVQAVTGVGDAIMFSVTTDGGAYSVTVMSGGKSDKAWPKTAEACAEVLLQVVAAAG